MIECKKRKQVINYIDKKCSPVFMSLKDASMLDKQRLYNLIWDIVDDFYIYISIITITSLILGILLGISIGVLFF